MESAIIYAEESDLSVGEFVDVLERSGLAERRPLADRERVERMLAHANLIVTAREDGRLLGVARSVTDFAYCCYLSDQAVDRDRQGRGIGKELVRQTRLHAGEECALLLLSAPGALPFYRAIGMTQPDNAFVSPRVR